MACKCGYEGKIPKMAFDVNEAYKCLVDNGSVYTIRPQFSNNLKREMEFRWVHLHRRHKFTGEEATKEGVEAGRGKDALLSAMPLYVVNSGFKTIEEWMNKLVEMHGEKVTTARWIIFQVTRQNW